MRSIAQEKIGINALLTAIVADNRLEARQLLNRDSTLATCSVGEPTLYESEIYHWLYAGDTALHLAAAGYRVEIARLLLEAGADVNSTENHRRSGPLHYAADGYISAPTWDADRQVAMIRCLIDAGADIHAQDLNGATPLHRAVRTRCAGAVRFLLDQGSDPTKRNKSGSTPFHLAVQNTGRGGSGESAAKEAQRQIIAEFFGRGVSPQLKDGKGKSVLDSARSETVRKLLIR